MKRFLVLTVVFVAMFMMVSCGGSENSDNDNNGTEEKKTYCEADAEKYVCHNDQSWRFECKKGEESAYSEEADFYYSSSESSQICQSGCDPDTGKCKPECEEGQYKCTNSDLSRGLIYSCDKDKQWEPTGKACDGECAKETAESVEELCGE